MKSPWLHSDLDRVWLLPEGATQRQLLAEACAVAAHVGSARRVVLVSRQARHFVPNLLGAWLAGATVELLPNSQPATIDRVRDALILNEVLAGSGGPPPFPAGPEIAVRLATSGTTARPRHSTKTMAQLTSEIEVLAAVLPPARTVLSTVPQSHIYGLLFGVLLPLRHGSAIVNHDALLLPNEVGAAIAAHDVDRLVSTPSHLRALVELMRPGMAVVSSGGRLPTELHLALGNRVTDVFGSTETGGVAMRSDPRAAWHPLPGVTVTADAADHAVVRSPWCDGGGTVLEDRIGVGRSGAFVHLGREGDLVKIGGKRADAVAIEQALRALPGVVDVALLVYTPTAGREPRVAVAVVRQGARPSKADVVEAIRRDFDVVFTPRIVRFVAAIPRSERGKVSADALRELFDLLAAPPGEISVRHLAGGRFHADIPQNLIFFAGHFEGRPVLPGVVLVDRLIWPAISAQHPDAASVRAVRRVRFRRPIVPAMEVTIEITRSGERVDFEVSSAGEIVASGQLFLQVKP